MRDSPLGASSGASVVGRRSRKRDADDRETGDDGGQQALVSAKSTF
jgi:hypothetical protein